MRGRDLLSVVALAGVAAASAMPGLSLPRQYLPPPKPPKPIDREKMTKAQEKRERRALRNLRNARLICW